MTVTGEAVALDLRPARLPSRILAAALDLLLQALLGLVLVLLALTTALSLDEAGFIAVTLALQVTILLAYPVLFETLWRGRTPGKAALGLRVVRDDGGPIGFRQALVRGLTGLLAERPGPLLFLPAVVSSLLSQRGKRIGDLLAGTFVQQERVPGGRVDAGSQPGVPPWLADWAATLDLTRLPDDLALQVRSFRGRAAAMTPQARAALGERLVAAVAATTSPPPPPGTPGQAYLDAVLAERRRRQSHRLAAGSAGSAPARAYDAGAAYGTHRSAAGLPSGASGAPTDGFAPPG